jgi:uncharacterized protein (TIGR00730 family)
MSNPASTICVFSSSSDAVAPHFFRAAEEVGALLAREGMTLIYGGGKVGLMGALAGAVHRHGGRVIGVIPHYLRLKEVAYEAADELIVTKDMRERKSVMEARADAFLSLPGGFGTLDEILEILTLKQLQQHAKPVVFLNTENFFGPLLDLFEHLYTHQFTKAESRQLYHVAPQPSEVFTHLQHYQLAAIGGKWFGGREDEKG